jgi:radical SAM superfamily enzyme YgiQ (UPF0313 family)
MKIALIIPMNSADKEKSFYDYKFYSTFLLSKKYVSYLLAIPVLSALTPDRHEVRVFDENIEAIDYDWPADLVGISVRTMFAKQAYAIAETYREKGVKTVMGGVHPSMVPDEVLEHCDSVVVGEAEYVWEKLLEDAENGSMKPIYQSEEKFDMTTSTTPQRETLSNDKYLSEIVQTTKGCPFDCEFCAVHAFDGQKIRHKTVEQVIHEVTHLGADNAGYKRKKAIFFADDNIIANKRYAAKLFEALKPVNVNWMCQASINISREDTLLELMRDSGCGAVFIGFETLSQKNLARMNKGINRTFSYAEAIQKIQSYGILVHSSFILGYDHDTVDSADELINFINGNNLLMPLINILTPFPGTKLFHRLESENRILHKDWSKYDTKNVVFSPMNMSPDDLLASYKKVIRSVYSFDTILDKLKHYWDTDFWHHANQINPVKMNYRILFALRLCSLLPTANLPRSRFALKILPRIFDKNVRISTILTMMAYNDFAYSVR